jgi:signal transduction histidine kinase
LRQNSEYLNLLQIITRAANSSESISNAIDVCIESICRYSKWPVGHACVLSKDEPNTLVSLSNWYLENADLYKEFIKVTEETTFKPGVGLPGRFLSSGEPAWIVDVNKDLNFPRAKIFANKEIYAGFAFPVLVGNKVVAVLEFFSDQQEELNAEFLELMRNVGTQIGRVSERESNAHHMKEEIGKVDATIQAKTNFLSSMSHEFMTPLNAIMGFGQMLETGINELSAADQEMCIRNILDGGAQLEDLIKNAILFSQIVDKKMAIERITVEAITMAKECLEHVQSKANEYEISLSLDVPSNDVSEIFIDPKYGKKIVETFLLNSIIYNHADGEAKLKVLQKNDGLVRFSIIDTGQGIKEIDHENVFKPFNRFGMENSPIGGSGIGLAVAKELSDQLDAQ